MKFIFIVLLLFTSLFATENIEQHFHMTEFQEYINHIQGEHFKYLFEITSLVVFIMILSLIEQYILRKRNRELELIAKEAVADLEKAQSVAKIGSWVYDLKNDKLRWSEEIYLMFEVNQNDTDNLYEKFISRVHPDDRAGLEDVYSSSLKNQTGYSLEHRLLMEDGSVKYVIENCINSFEEDGTPIISHGTVQDITEATLVKNELKEKDAHLFQQSRLAMMGEMLSMIAHQWRQPLGTIAANTISIQSAIELEQYNLKDAKDEEEFLNFLNKKMDKTTLYIQDLSQTITNFSNFYKPDKKFIMVDITDVLLKAYNLVFDSLDSHGIKVEFSLDSNYEFMMHENEFTQVILNIINNAKDQLLQNSIENPVININTYMQNERLYIEISDNAGGIEEKSLDKVFDPYYSTKLEKNGTGLGLYMSKVIIKDYHKGDIYAKNGDSGAIFTIEIKKREDEVADARS